MDVTTALLGARLAAGALQALLGNNQPSAPGPSADEPAQTAPSSGITEAAREIVGRYDVTDITPRQFTQMVQDLHQAGVISESQLEELSQIRLDLDTEGLDPDESLDLVAFYADKLDQQSAQSPPDAIGSRLAWAGKLALMQSGPQSLGLDALA